MATNKNASYRYRVINNCLKNTARKWTLNDLIETISEKLAEDLGIYKGVSKRTVQNDISIMRSMCPRGFDAPIVCKDGNYFYEDPNYSINNSPLNEKDIESLQEAIGIFNQFKSIPVFEDLNSMVFKLEGKMLSGKDKRKIIDFEKVENVKGIELIKPLYDFIRDNQVIEIIYRPFNRTESQTMLIHPYFIKEFNNRWFLIAYNEELEKMSHLALDRMLKINKKDKQFKYSSQFDANLYFNNIIGITLPAKIKPELIELSFSPQRAPYIKTKPIHKSQKIIDDNNTGLRIQLDLVINKELISLLLGFGSDIKIIKPDSLKREIQEIIQNSLTKYE